MGQPKVKPMLLLAAAVLAAPLSAQDRSVEEYVAAVEGPQSTAGPAEVGGLTITELMEEFGVPGVSVAVIRDFEIHWAKGYGIADVESGAPVDTETLFQAASISKPVAAMAVMRAVQDGMFGLDTDINEILTSWTLDGAGFTDRYPVTPRSLTSHTSGLGDGFGFPGYDPGATIPSVVQILDGHESSNVGPLFMERPPYTGEEYSGGGVTLMQQALADAHGRAFADIMRDVVLDPIGMERSTYDQPLDAERDRNAARAHDGEGAPQGPKWHVYPEQAAAGLWTTPSDLARLLIEMQKSVRGESNRVLDRSSALEMLTPVGVGGFGIGFAIARRGRGWYFSHGGSNWGFRATMMAHRLHGYGLVIMTNADRGGAVLSEVSRRIQEAYEWDLTLDELPRGYDAVEKEYIDVDASVLERYVGIFEGEGVGRLNVTVEDGGLFVRPDGEAKLQVFPETETRFSPRSVAATLEFIFDQDGEVDGLIVRQGGQEITIRKVGP
ncbi:MAG: serine hydrolase [Gemmatimonadota bacterium]|nr:serine hydrolase [Gemmatimonadota bacterium]